MERKLTRAIIALISLPLFPAAAIAQETQLPLSPRSVTTQGEAVVNVSPDEFTIAFRVQTYDKQLLPAYDLNEKNSANVLALAKKYSLKPGDFQTSEMSIHPEYSDARKGPRTIEAYHVDRQIVFRLKDRKLISSLIRDALNSGANSLLSLGFETSEIRKHRDNARTLALKAAREKADLLANTLGAKLGKPLRIEETAGAPQRGYYNNVSNSRLLQQYQYNMFQVEPTVVEDLPGGIALGSIAVKGAVTATFELE